MLVNSIKIFNANNTNDLNKPNINFRSAKINEKKLLNNLSKETYKSIDAYITNLLNVVTDLDSNEIKYVIKIGLDKAKSLDKSSFYDFYSKIMKQIMITRKRIRPNNRENWYADNTLKILGDREFNKNSVYLDIGCGDCSITKSIVDKVGVDIQNTYGIDLLKRQHINGIDREKFDGKNIPSNIPKADFVTIFQVLHHIKTQKEALELLNSVCKHLNDGGLLLVREHEVNNLNDKKFWKFIHDFQCRVIKTASENLDNGTLYMHSSKWERLFNKVGFRTIRKDYDIKYNDKSSYFMLFEK